MSSGCNSCVCCVDAREPVRASYQLLYKWPDSDVEFVKSMAAGKRAARGDLHGCGDVKEGREQSSCPSVVDSYSCRQLYLRSYTFTKKETVPEKTRRCLSRVKQTAAVLPICRQSSVKSSDFSAPKSVNTERKREAADGCAGAWKYSSVFRRLLLCAGSVEVVD
ncbi:hypothetical protein B296_00041090 [Ensete ventricosum]|uniref:Uncharacterized protein n=1 Tax=Ensete ventricosum TaxID=4639 RepID=A0A426Z271_ENSVE|nr:hypothetical protein B296_00041090 [Ensete ventricosum]